jgi:uncharacterized protein YpbB
MKVSNPAISQSKVQCSHIVTFINWTSPDAQDNKIYHILKDRRWRSSVLDARLFRAADCDNNHYLMVANVREKPSIE